MNISSACEYVCDANTDRWLELRRTGIGASDAHRVIASPLSLYLEKRGEVGPEKLEGEWLDWGHKLEGIIVKELGSRVGVKTDRCGKMYRSIREPWMLASIDGLAYDADGTVCAVVEAKNVGAWNAGDWEDGAPDRYRYQVQVQMHVTGLRVGYICALIGGQRFVFERVSYDEKWIAAYVSAGRELWRRIQDGDPPAADGSADTARAIKELHPNDNGETIALPGELIDIDSELADLKARKKTIEDEVRLRESIIKTAIGDATFGVLANGVTYSWKTHHKNAYQVDAQNVRTLTRKRAA